MTTIIVETLFPCPRNCGNLAFYLNVNGELHYRCRHCNVTVPCARPGASLWTDRDHREFDLRVARNTLLESMPQIEGRDEIAKIDRDLVQLGAEL